MLADTTLSLPPPSHSRLGGGRAFGFAQTRSISQSTLVGVGGGGAGGSGDCYGRDMELAQGNPAERGEDVVLAELIASGNEAALEAVFSAHHGPCWRLARKITQDESAASDVVQDVFLAFWRRPSSYDGGRGTLSTWLLSITHHKAVDYVRKEAGHLRRIQREKDLGSGARTAPPTQDLVAEQDAVQRALSGLPEVQRQVLILAYFGGYTQQEISDMLEMPLGTVKSRTLTAMRRLREVMTVTGGDAS